MNALKTPLRLARASNRIRLQNTTTTSSSLPRRRHYAAESSPPPLPPKEPSRVGTFYRTFSYPILKTFLGALFTYQLTYYAWMKLEYFEEKQDKQGEIEGLKEELKEVVAERREKARDVVAGVGEVVEEKGKRLGSWFG